jgi:His-Xaa-Ser system radical SAM maturase HxsC
MKLTAKARFAFSGEPFLGRLEAQAVDGSFGIRNLDLSGPPSATLALSEGCSAGIVAPTEFDYLRTGDILRFVPSSGDVRVLYRRNSRHNFLFFTDRCNSRCLMCSQPPRDADDGYLVEDILRMIPWMDHSTPELGITGGEPTLLQQKLLDVLTALKVHLPSTSVHMLTNGRLLSYLRYAQRLAEVGHADLMLGVPLYADVADVHDFVVQAKGAFDQTVFGLLNLARTGVRVEIRMVVHRHTYARLPQFARFVVRNLPFASHVALMGLELMGYARSNLSSLWIDPVDYQEQLEEAVSVLLFNHQLCLLPPSLHPYARKSISDWKNVYMPECEPCARKVDCGGFFASAGLRYSAHIRPYQ